MVLPAVAAEKARRGWWSRKELNLDLDDALSRSAT